MSARIESLAAVRRVAAALGPDVDRVVVAGAAAAATYDLGPQVGHPLSRSA